MLLVCFIAIFRVFYVIFKICFARKKEASDDAAGEIDEDVQLVELLEDLTLQEQPNNDNDDDDNDGDDDDN